MDRDSRSQLRALFERELPDVLKRAECSDPWVTDRVALAVFVELLSDGPAHRELLTRGREAQAAWLRERVDEADRPLGVEGDVEEPAECVREAASEWVTLHFAGELAPSAEPGFWAHVGDCEACQARYRVLRAEEGDRVDVDAERVRRLARGLPWSEVEEPEPEASEEDEPEPIAPEDAAAVDASAPPPAERAEAPADSGAEQAGEDTPDPENQRFWLTRRGRMTVYFFAAVLFVAANVYLILMPRTKAFELQEETPAQRVVKPLPPQGLALALLRYQPHVMHDMPWSNVQGAVAAGDRLLLTYSLDEGTKEQKGRPRFLTIVAIDDRGRLHWLRPAVTTAGGVTSPAVRVPAQAAKLERELRAPAGIERLVFYAVVTEQPVQLSVIQRALSRAFRSADFHTSPPLLNIDHSLQQHRVVDVLR